MGYCGFFYVVVDCGEFDLWGWYFVYDCFFCEGVCWVFVLECYGSLSG